MWFDHFKKVVMTTWSKKRKSRRLKGVSPSILGIMMSMVVPKGWSSRRGHSQSHTLGNSSESIFLLSSLAFVGVVVMVGLIKGASAEIKFIPVNILKSNVAGEVNPLANKVDRSEEPLAVESTTYPHHPYPSTPFLSIQPPPSTTVLHHDNNQQASRQVPLTYYAQRHKQQQLYHQRPSLLLQPPHDDNNNSDPTERSAHDGLFSEAYIDEDLENDTDPHSSSVQDEPRPPIDFAIYALPEQSFWSTLEKKRRRKIPASINLGEDHIPPGRIRNTTTTVTSTTSSISASTPSSVSVTSSTTSSSTSNKEPELAAVVPATATPLSFSGYEYLPSPNNNVTSRLPSSSSSEEEYHDNLENNNALGNITTSTAESPNIVPLVSPSNELQQDDIASPDLYTDKHHPEPVLQNTLPDQGPHPPSSQQNVNVEETEEQPNKAPTSSSITTLSQRKYHLAQCMRYCIDAIL